MFLHLSVILSTVGRQAGVGIEGVSAQGVVCPGPGGCLGRHPSMRWPLVRSVRILLECILVLLLNSVKKLRENSNDST